MTPSLKAQKFGMKCLIGAIVSLIIDIYYLQSTNQFNVSNQQNVVFVMTSILAATFLVSVTLYFKENYDEIQRRKVSDFFGYTALILLFGGFFFFGILWVGTPPTWLSDLFIQAIAITAIGCFTCMAKKGSYNLAISMVFPFMAIIVYLCYRF